MTYGEKILGFVRADEISQDFRWDRAPLCYHTGTAALDNPPLLCHTMLARRWDQMLRRLLRKLRVRRLASKGFAAEMQHRQSRCDQRHLGACA